MSAGETTGTPIAAAPSGTVGEVFAIFLRLGLTSFGGPIAHLGYFRDAFVTRRKWLDEQAYADLSPCVSSCRDRRRARSVSPSG